MYAYCARYLWSQRDTRRNAAFTLAYITTIFVIETVFVAVQARTVQLCYVDNRVSTMALSVTCTHANITTFVNDINA